MKLKTLFVIASIYTAVAGLAFIFAPRAVGTGAIPADPAPELLAYVRLLGAPLLGIAVLDWMARDADPSRVRTAVIVGNAVGFGSIALLDIWGVLSGARQPTIIFAFIHSAFALAFILIGQVTSPQRSAADMRAP